MTKTFKNKMGQLLLLGLFYETTGADKSSVVYTLKDYDHEGYESLQRLYLEEADPTEYSFAIKHLDSWKHWQALCKAKWFQPYLEKWRYELEVKLRSEAINRIRAESASGGKSAFQAMKYLADAGWAPKASSKASVGRPSKDAIRQAADELFHAQNEVDDDFERIVGTPAGNA